MGVAANVARTQYAPVAYKAKVYVLCFPPRRGWAMALLTAGLVTERSLDCVPRTVRFAVGTQGLANQCG